MRSFCAVMASVARYAAVGVAWWIGLVAIVALTVGVRNFGRLIGAATLINVEYPTEFPLLETWRGLILTAANSYVQFRHWSTRMTVEDVVVVVEKAMTSSGYEKLAEKDVKESGDNLRAHWLLYRSRGAPFCFDVVVRQENDMGTTQTVVTSVYKPFFASVYERECDIVRQLTEEIAPGGQRQE